MICVNWPQITFCFLFYSLPLILLQAHLPSKQSPQPLEVFAQMSACYWSLPLMQPEQTHPTLWIPSLYSTYFFPNMLNIYLSIMFIAYGLSFSTRIWRARMFIWLAHLYILAMKAVPGPEETISKYLLNKEINE